MLTAEQAKLLSKSPPVILNILDEVKKKALTSDDRSVSFVFKFEYMTINGTDHHISLVDVNGLLTSLRSLGYGVSYSNEMFGVTW